MLCVCVFVCFFFRETSAELIKSARAASADPNNPELRQKVFDADKRLQALIQKMVALTSPDDEDAENKLLFTSQYLDGLMEQLCGRAADLSRQELLDFARRIVQASKTLAKDARAVAEQTSDPKKRQEILDAVTDMEGACAEVVRAISALAEKPGDPKLVARLKELKEKFNYAVHRVRAAAGLEELRNQKKVIDLSQRNEDPLVAAARRQAEVRLSLSWAL
jgi:Talin IBS2B domain